jgi:hypothetical protein
MDYDKIDVEAEVIAILTAVENGQTRLATKRESMAVRLAALSDIVHEMQITLKNDKEPAGATGGAQMRDGEGTPPVVEERYAITTF